MIFSVLTLFPGIFESPLNESLIAKAREKRLLDFNIVDIRDFATDVHRTCDDAPFGGGAGMVMKVEPIYRAMEAVREAHERTHFVPLRPMAGHSARRRPAASRACPHIALVCGRYEGVDERILSLVDDEISIGDYILSGGEAAALCCYRGRLPADPRRFGERGIPCGRELR
jgi:tRNA (guanine37-N1)-methyltransferase